MLPRIFLTTPRGQEPVGRAVVTESQSEHYVGNRNMAANIKGKKGFIFSAYYEIFGGCTGKKQIVE